MEFSKTDPRAAAVILLVMLLIGAAVYLRLWANTERLEVPAIRAMAVSPQGNVHIVVGNTLFIESPGGESLQRVDLAEWGVEDFHGDLVVLNDGSVILARGQLPAIDAAEAVRIVARAPAHGDPSEKLMRCLPVSNTCSVLDGNDDGSGFALARAFSIDTDDRFLYVSEPAKHRVLKLSLQGELVASHDAGWRFPNDIRVAAFDRIGFADTNHHRYVEATLDTEGFGTFVEESDIAGWPHIVRDSRFPSAALKDETGTLWMLVAHHDMANAALYRKPADGEAKLLPLPDDADPIAIEKIAGSILVGDWHTFRIYRFNLAGELQPDFGSPQLQQALARLRERHDLWQMLFDFSLIGVLIVAVPALVFGYRMQQKTQEKTAQHQEGETVETVATAPVIPRSHEAQYALLRGEFIFWRKHTALSTDGERAFLFAMVAFPLLMWAMLAWLILTDPEGGGMQELLANQATVVLAGGLLLAFFAAWLSAMFERIVVTGEGIRYTSLFPKPFSRFLMPDWFLRWEDIREIRLEPGAIAKAPAMWRYRLFTTRGRTREIKAFAWRLAGEKEVGVAIGSLRKLDPQRIRATLQQTVLYRLLARGMKDAKQQQAA